MMKDKTSDFAKGDLVIKEGHYDKGKVGLVISTSLVTASGEKILEVLCDGDLKKWYTGTVRLANEKNRLSEGKSRQQE